VTRSYSFGDVAATWLTIYSVLLWSDGDLRPASLRETVRSGMGREAQLRSCTPTAVNSRSSADVKMSMPMVGTTVGRSFQLEQLGCAAVQHKTREKLKSHFRDGRRASSLCCPARAMLCHTATMPLTGAEAHQLSSNSIARLNCHGRCVEEDAVAAAETDDDAGNGVAPIADFEVERRDVGIGEVKQWQAASGRDIALN
jgi:hypothetical protein